MSPDMEPPELVIEAYGTVTPPPDHEPDEGHDEKE